jgi:hypothetical protein
MGVGGMMLWMGGALKIPTRLPLGINITNLLTIGGDAGRFGRTIGGHEENTSGLITRGKR